MGTKGPQGSQGPVGTKGPIGPKGPVGNQGATGQAGVVDLTELDKKADKTTTKKFFTGDAYSGTDASTGKVIKPDTNDYSILKIFDSNGTDILLDDISGYSGATGDALKYITNYGFALQKSTNSGDTLWNSTNSDYALSNSTNSYNALWNSTNSGWALDGSKNSDNVLRSSTNSDNVLQYSTNSGWALRDSTNSGDTLQYSKNYGNVLWNSKNSGLALANSSFTNWNLNKRTMQPMRFYMTSAKNITFINGVFTKDSFSCPKTIPDGQIYGDGETAPAGGNTANPLLLGSWAGTSFTNWFYTGDILADGSPRTDDLGPTKTAGPDLSGIPASVRAQIRPISERGKLALGTKGADGKQGPVGPRGTPGMNGQDGSAGLTGADGPQGIVGPTGIDRTRRNSRGQRRHWTKWS